MMMRKFVLALGIGLLIVSGYYVLAYLYWWEWNRALIVAAFFIAIELAIAVLLLLARLDRLERRIDAAGGLHGRERTLGILRESAPPARSTFAWLDPKASAGQTHVFIPILLGAGIVLSGLAWLIERVARAWAAPSFERDLAAQLDGLRPAVGGFLHDRDGGLLRRPVQR
jgi:hypothetical protein